MSLLPRLVVLATLIAPALAAQGAGERIRDSVPGTLVTFELARVRYGVINIIDATASYPHDRWVDFLERVVARGGSPHR